MVFFTTCLKVKLLSALAFPIRFSTWLLLSGICIPLVVNSANSVTMFAVLRMNLAVLRSLFLYNNSFAIDSNSFGVSITSVKWGLIWFGVSLVGVRAIIQYILAFRKTETFTDQSQDYIPLPEPIAPTFAVFGRGGSYEVMAFILTEVATYNQSRFALTKEMHGIENLHRIDPVHDYRWNHGQDGGLQLHWYSLPYGLKQL